MSLPDQDAGPVFKLPAKILTTMFSISSAVLLIAVWATRIVGGKAATIANADTSLTLLFQNNLNASDDVNHVGFIMLDSAMAATGQQSCASIGQSLLSVTVAQNYSTDLALSLAYQEYAGYTTDQSSYLIDGQELSLSSESTLSFAAAGNSASGPVICSNSALQSRPQNSTATVDTSILISAGSNTYQGYFNKKSFRFNGIRYAQQPERFEYSELYEPQGQTINATTYGSQCIQGGGGEEDCLFLNIQTPMIPKSGSTEALRPVMFWIHGGGFTGGTGADPLSDGSNLASREDIVVVTINYRLSTLGFLAIPGTNITGNFGIADQVVALQWAVDNIAYFGGDPNQITINGESAGAGSVRTLLGSPKAIGLYQGAVAMSNLGGGQDLGLESNYGTTYSLYYSIDQSYNVSGSKIINSTNCTSESISDSIACLKAVNASTLVNLPTVARYVVQDNIFVNTSNLNVLTPYNGTAHVPTIFGIVADDGASFSNLPPTNLTEGNLTGALQVGLGISASYANAIITSNLFPFSNTTGNYTLDAFNVTARVATDNTFRCIDQATIFAAATNNVFPRAYYYQVERTIDGYNPNSVPGAPITPGYPYGNPILPYFRLHGSDMPWIFGNFYDPLRDDDDLYSVQLVSGYFGAFVRQKGDPNPNLEFVKVRGYEETEMVVAGADGRWEAVKGSEGEQGVVRHLDYPGYSSGWVDVEQCKFLNYSLSYYLDGGI